LGNLGGRISRGCGEVGYVYFSMEIYMKCCIYLIFSAIIKMKKIAIFFILSLISIQLEAQIVDTLKITEKAKGFIASFKNKSFEEYKKLLLNKDDYILLAKIIHNNNNFNNKQIEREYQSIEKIVKVNYNNILKKGDSKGIKWEELTFQGMVFNTYDRLTLGLSGEDILIVDSHIRIRFRDKK
jgi:hypothetical protein